MGHQYRKLFGLTYWQLIDEPIGEIRKAVYIAGLLQEKTDRQQKSDAWRRKQDQAQKKQSERAAVFKNL